MERRLTGNERISGSNDFEGATHDMPLSQFTVMEVQRLLKLGELTHRQIARAVGIGRTMVCKIASGKRLAWPDREPRHSDRYTRPTGPVVHCRGCGGRVYMPCRLCHVRGLKAIDRGDAIDAGNRMTRSPAD
jgi:hypothetical protein